MRTSSGTAVAASSGRALQFPAIAVENTAAIATASRLDAA
jgi:hypothetical protein